MFILGLTGSIAMGKTTAAKMFALLGAAVFDADRAVHELLNTEKVTISEIDASFPGVVRCGTVDRKLLADRVFASRDALVRLERIVHPEVTKKQRRFLRIAARQRRKLVVLDVPLLFETGGHRGCDAVAVVTAPWFVQNQRLRSRVGVDPQRLAATLSRQLPDAEKRRLADFLIPSGLGRAATMQAIRRIVTQCMSGKVDGEAQHRNNRCRGWIG